jgi:DNA-binding IscR family transcriptional regulator
MSSSTNNNVIHNVANLLETRTANGERVTLAQLAESENISSNEARKILIQAFGSRVQFKRGRTGGVVLTAN